MKRDLTLPFIKTVVLFVSFLLADHSFAQTIQNETSLFIPVGIEVHAADGLLNTGFIQNNGSVSLPGDWMNKNVYQGTGVVILTGRDQVFFNNNQSIENLIVDGGGTKTLQNKLIVNKSIDFANGIMLVSDRDTLFLATDCVANGGSTSSYVEGALITKGSGYKFYPVGKNGNYRPVELVNVKGATPVIEVEVFEELPSITTALATTMDQSVYWSRKTIDGSFTGSPIALAYADNVSNRTVIAEGESLTESFSLISDLSSQSKDNIQWLNSPGDITKNIIAIGELVNDPPKPYYLSTTLSPNAADPDNRTVKVFGEELNDSFYFQVFNRWGISIFESKSYSLMSSSGWDGKQNGIGLPSGVYPYSVKYVDQSGKANQHTGFITIIN